MEKMINNPIGRHIDSMLDYFMEVDGYIDYCDVKDVHDFLTDQFGEQFNQTFEVNCIENIKGLLMILFNKMKGNI